MSLRVHLRRTWLSHRKKEIASLTLAMTANYNKKIKLARKLLHLFKDKKQKMETATQIENQRENSESLPAGREVLRNIVGEIVNSYETKVEAVTSLINQVYQRIKNFHTEQSQLAERLKEILAKRCSFRKKDFETMMTETLNHQETREKELGQMVEDFCKEEEEMVAKLKEILIVKSPSTLEDFKILKEKMLSRPKERERKVSQVLKDFHRDQEELNTALSLLLEKGPSVKIKDFKAMIRAFSIDHTKENARIDEILEEFERVKDEIGNQWQKVMATVGK